MIILEISDSQKARACELKDFIVSERARRALSMGNQVLISVQVRCILNREEIASFVWRHLCCEWGIYKLEWEAHQDSRVGRYSVCSSFDLESGLRLLVKSDRNTRRTLVRFDHERLETKRCKAASENGGDTWRFNGP